MKKKRAGFFLLAVLISCLLAVHRWGDSSHAIGSISQNGGKVRHPAIMKAGKGRYSQITTINVLPPFQGNAKIVLEGSPALDYEIYLSTPVVDFGFRPAPQLRGNILYNLKAGDRLALWTLIRPVHIGDIGKKATLPGDVVADLQKTLFSLADWGKDTPFLRPPLLSAPPVSGRYALAFYDAATERPLLKIPMIFNSPEKTHD